MGRRRGQGTETPQPDVRGTDMALGEGEQPCRPQARLCALAFHRATPGRALPSPVSRPFWTWGS